MSLHQEPLDEVAKSKLPPAMPEAPCGAYKARRSAGLHSAFAWLCEHRRSSHSAGKPASRASKVGFLI